MTGNLAALGTAVLTGIASGTDAAIWGMYKDAAHEGFRWPRFFRSIALGGAAAVVIQQALDLDVARPGNVLVLFGLAYAAERALVETWKTFVRVEDQAKYAIPMQFAIRGQPVRSQGLRLVGGVMYVVLLGTLILTLARLPMTHSTTLLASVMGFVAGLVIAMGGAWKDAPIEGFEGLKFLRSPVLTTLFALALFPLASNALLAALASVGYERATSENYKTFCFPSRPRGKFAGKPVTHPSMLRSRRRFIPAYVVIRLLLAWLVTQAYAVQPACVRFVAPCPSLSSGQLMELRP